MTTQNAKPHVLEGQRLPELSFPVQVDGQWQTWTTQGLFAGKKVVVFSLPGAFTPTCSSSHVPRFNQLAATFKAQGVDSIVCISVNDTFVMNAWKADQDADKITFLPDGNGALTEALGMLVDKSAIGFGKRSWRYSMFVDDGVIKKIFSEPDVEGDPFQVSDADTMLNYLAPNAAKPADVLLFTKPGCGHCRRAKEALQSRGMGFAEVQATPGMLRAVSQTPTTPQIFINGEHIGGADALDKFLSSKAAA